MSEEKAAVCAVGFELPELLEELLGATDGLLEKGAFVYLQGGWRVDAAVGGVPVVGGGRGRRGVELGSVDLVRVEGHQVGQFEITRFARWARGRFIGLFGVLLALIVTVLFGFVIHT